MILAMARDIRVILVKLADRTHNMRTLGHLPTDKQLEIAQETLDIYAPLAHRLGIYWMKTELEDNALRYLHPEVYYQLKRSDREEEGRARALHQGSHRRAREEARSGGRRGARSRAGRSTSTRSTRRCSSRTCSTTRSTTWSRSASSSTRVRECYEALGVVHANWKPVPGRFKDYIALPKANCYQSLHTTVIGPYGERIEVQIRTHEMHRVAEYGIAAHWRYKGSAADASRRRAALRLAAPARSSGSSICTTRRSSCRSVKEDLFAEEVFVFTPKGDILNFPEGATVIDFAYRIHSEVGHHCTGARGERQARAAALPAAERRHGRDHHHAAADAVQGLAEDRQDATRRARRSAPGSRLSSARGAWTVGREILERDLGRYKLEVSKLRKDGRLDKLLEELSLKDEEGLLAAVGYGRITPHQVLSKLLPPGELKEHPAAKPEGALKKLFRLVARQQAPGQRGRVDGVRVSGVEDVLVRFGRCCSPLPGESIAGFITLGRGVTVHSASCPRVMESDSARRVDVVWDGVATALRAVKVEVVCVDQPGMLASISKVISSSGINIARAEVRTDGQQRAVSSFHLMVTSAEALNHVMRAIGKLRGVLRVSRVAA